MMPETGTKPIGSNPLKLKNKQNFGFDPADK